MRTARPDEAAERRALVRAALLEAQVRNQAELVAHLEALGHSVTQSCVSRDLRDLGARKIGGRYRIAPDRRPGLPGLAGLVESFAAAGPHLVVIRTLPGGAQRVAHAIDTEDVAGGGWFGGRRRHHLRRESHGVGTARDHGPAAGRNRHERRGREPVVTRDLRGPIGIVVLGASGYVAGELLRWIAGHPRMRLAGAVSASHAGLPIRESFPNLASRLPGRNIHRPGRTRGAAPPRRR